MPIFLSKQVNTSSHVVRGYGLSFFIDHNRFVLWSGLLVGGYVLWRLGNGFPPAAWQTLRQLSTEGVPEQPVVPVMIRSLLLLISWLVLVLLGLHTLRPRSFLYSRQNTRSLSFKRTSSSLTDTPKRMQEPFPLPAGTTGVPRANAGKSVISLQDVELAKLTLLKLDIFSSQQANPTFTTTFSNHDESRPSDTQHRSAPSMAINGAIYCHREGKPTDDCDEDTLLYASCVHSSGIAPTYNTAIHFGLFILVSASLNKSSTGRPTSRICAQTISHEVLTLAATYTTIEDTHIEQMLRRSLERTNRQLHRYNLKYKTTKTAMVTVLLTTGKAAYIAHVGTNHGYIYRPQRGFALLSKTSQHKGNMDDSNSHVRTNKEGIGMGLEPKLAMHIQRLTLRPDDVVVMCSSGLWRAIPKNTFFHLVTEAAQYGYEVPTDIMNALVRAVRTRGGDRNVIGGSACVIQAQLCN